MVYKIKETAYNYWNDRRLRYLFIGAINTAIGYIISLGLYVLLREIFNIIIIAILINIICITFSFSTFKFIVFQTKGNWLNEYVKCYIVYGFAMVINVIGLWLLVGILGFAFWYTQAALLLITVLISYFGHARFTFGKRKEKK